MQRPDTEDGLFHAGDPLTGQKGTPITAAWLNALLAVGALFHGSDNPPDVALGDDGDHYLNSVGMILYGPKSGGVWPAGISLKADGLYKTYATKALADADLANIPADGLIWINVDAAPANNGYWAKTGGVLVQSSWDRVAQIEAKISYDENTSGEALRVLDSAGTSAFELDQTGRLAVRDVLFGNARSLATLAADVDIKEKLRTEMTGVFARSIDKLFANYAPIYAASSTIYNITADGGASYRIPIICRISANQYIIFSSQQGSGDFSAASIVYRTITVSSTGTITLGSMLILEAGGPDDGGGKAYQYILGGVVRTSTGRIIVLGGYRNEDALVHVPYKWISDDDGATWDAKVDITATFPQLSTGSPTNWNAIIFGPAKGLQIMRGPYAGRIVWPYWRSGPNTLYPSGTTDLWAGFVYSDDDGATIELGTESHLSRANESSVAQDLDGNVLLFSRREARAGRWVSVSRDGGEHIHEHYKLDQGVVNTPVSESAAIQAANVFDHAAPKIIYAAPRPTAAATNTTGAGRDHPTVFASYDGGRSFPYRYEMGTGYCGYVAVDAFGEDGFLVVWESINSFATITAKVISVKNIMTGA